MTEGNDIAWNGTYFIAVGSTSGHGVVAISYDGFHWTSLQNTLFTNITKVVWTGYLWIIYGVGSSNVATSTDGFYWTSLNKTIESFSSHVCPIVTNRFVFIQKNIHELSQYDTSCNYIQDISCGFLNYISTTCFDGENFIAFDTSNNVYQLTDLSANFQKIDISCNLTNIYDSTFNEKIVIIGGIDPSGCIAYNKINFSNKFNYSFSKMFTSINGISSNSGFGFVHKPNAIYLNPNEKLSIITPKYYTNSIIPPTNITMNIYANENSMI